jgi:uncharacterized RDD family membrane protein YckC
MSRAWIYGVQVEPNATGLVSGEGVRLALQPAGVGSRTVAAAVDILVQFGVLLILVLIDSAAAGGTDSDALTALLIVELVLVLAGYPIVMEWSTKGRTLGKLWFGLRVVRDDGGPIGFRHALVRGLAGLVLEKPGLLFPLTTIAGVATMSSSAREKRLGDMMAGTVVLNEHSAPQPLATPPAWVPPPLQPWVLSLDLHRLDDRLALAVRQFAARAYAMTPAARYQLGEVLRTRVLAVTSPPPPPGVPTHDLLLSVLAERRRRAMPPLPPVAAGPGWPVQPPPAPVPLAPQPTLPAVAAEPEPPPVRRPRPAPEQGPFVPPD